MARNNSAPSPTSPLIGKRRRRPPPTLRTKTGCLTCRSRKKKCDERRPRCEACFRNRLSCKWIDGEVFISPQSPPHPIQDLFSPESSDATSKSPSLYEDDGEVVDRRLSSGSEEDSLGFVTHQYTSRMNLAAAGLEAALEVDLLQHVRRNLLPTLISCYAAPGFKIQEVLLSETSQPRPLMEALLALSSMHVSNQVPGYNAMAVRYYSNSMSFLRKQVAKKDVVGSEDYLLIHVVWFFLFEIWRMRLNHLRGASAHLLGCLQILRIRRVSSNQREETISHPLDRLVAESVLYHIATLAIFDRALLCIPVSYLKNMLTVTLTNPAFPDSSAIANSPVLVAPPELYFLVLEVSQLLSRAPLNTTDYLLATQLEYRLQKLQTENLDFLTPMDDPLKLIRAAYLYVAAMEALLFRLKDPGTTCNNPRIRKYVSIAISILRTRVMDQPCKQYFCWPLLIFSTLLREPEDIVFVRHELQRAWHESSCGNVLVVLQVLDIVSERYASGEEVNCLEFLNSLQGQSEGRHTGLSDNERFEPIE